MPPAKSRVRFLWIWVVLVVLYFLWEAASYTGLFARAAEWQLAHLGEYLPTLTFGLLVLLFGSPALLLFRRRRRRDAADAQADPSPAAQEAAASAAVVGTRFMRFLFWISGALAAAALASLLWTITLPSGGGTPREVVLGTASDRAPAEGAVRLVGVIVYKRTAAFTQGLLVMRRGARYAPVFPPGDHDNMIRYFIELAPQDHLQPRMEDAVVVRTGILVRDSLPGALVRLFRYAGYRVASPHYVLYASPLTMRWHYYVTAVEFALGALVFLIVALFQRRHVRRLGAAADAGPVAQTA
jgi:hypothetical protein